MARIVITSWGSFGDVNPYLALATALRAAGHLPVLAMPPFYRAVIEQHGFAFHPVAPDADPALDRDMVVRVMNPRRGAQTIFRDVLMPALAEGTTQLLEATRGADLLISHPAALAAPIVAELTGVRWLSTVLSPLNFLSAYDPVIPPLAPWIRHLGYPTLRRLAPWMSRGGRTLAATWVEEVQRLRVSLGLPRGAHPIFEGQWSALGVLALFSPVLGAPQADWPANVTITGQLRHDTAHGASLGVELEQFLAADDAPIVFTLGSSAVEVAGTFFDESAAAVQRMGRRGILLMGPGRSARLRTSLPPELLAVDAAPHSLLFPRAAAVVHQCGMGTLGTALHAGVPTLAVPFANDQPDNAWRIERLGVSRTLYPTRYRAERVAQELTSLLRAPQYTDRAREVAAVVRQEPGARAALEVIEAALP